MPCPVPLPAVSARPYWQGVFPAITTQMRPDGSLDLEATAAHVEVLIASGVSGIVFLGSLGENQAMTADEKRLVITEMVRAVDSRVTVLSGVAETSTEQANRYIADCQKVGADGVMLMPPMCYRSDDGEERLAFFRQLIGRSPLPVMAYNNPLAYGNDLTAEMFDQLSDLEMLVAIKESSGDTRRITDLHNRVPGRFSLFTGVDPLALESAILGIDGWVAGTGIAFPAHNQRLWDLTRSGDWDQAVPLYRWFTPLLHLDTAPRFVQYIKLCLQEMGLGREWTRPPRLPLAGQERERVLGIIRRAIDSLPALR